MRLFVTDKVSHTKQYLNIIASSRIELANLIGSPWFNLNDNQYHVHEVVAEATNANSTAVGAVVGGAIGLLGGPLGVLIGGALGGALGNGNDKGEINRVQFFNKSQI